MFSKLLITHTISRILDFLISSLENLASHHFLDLEEVSSMIKPLLLDSCKTMPEIKSYVKSNTIIFFQNGIVSFIDRTSDKVSLVASFYELSCSVPTL
jgi:hypothetical protein